MDEGFGDHEGQFGSTDGVEKKTDKPKTISDEWPGNREGQFGSSNPLTPKTVSDDEWPGNREQQR